MTEIELKLSLDRALAPRLRRHALLAGVKPVAQRVRSTYLDTPEWDLVGRGIAFRVRRMGNKWVQTLKAEADSVGALTRRAEWEMDLPRGRHDPGRLPPEALARLEGVDLARIGPAFVTDFRRAVWQVKRDGAEMEVALDLGEIRAGARTQPLAELEIELKSGPPRALFDLALALLEQVPMGVEPRSKAARGYVLAGAVVPTPVKAAMPAFEPGQSADRTWLRMAGGALAQAVANVPGFLTTPQDIEYLHQLRVGLRRLHTMACLAGSLGRSPPAWDRDLKAVMVELNGARDWDVFMHQTLPRLEVGLGDPPLSSSLRRGLARASSAARHKAQAAVSGAAFTRLVLEIGRYLQDEPRDDPPLQPWAAACLEKRWKQLLKRGKGYARLGAAQRHRLRIAAKRLRYTADVLATAFSGSRKFLVRLGKLQDRLGAMQDEVVALRLLTGLRSGSPAVQLDAGRLAGLVAGGGAGRTGGGKAWTALAASRPFWRVKARR